MWTSLLTLDCKKMFMAIAGMTGYPTSPIEIPLI